MDEKIASNVIAHRTLSNSLAFLIPLSIRLVISKGAFYNIDRNILLRLTFDVFEYILNHSFLRCSLNS